MEGVPTNEYKGVLQEINTRLDTKELITPFRKEDDTLHKAHFLLAALMAKTDSWAGGKF